MAKSRAVSRGRGGRKTGAAPRAITAVSQTSVRHVEPSALVAALFEGDTATLRVPAGGTQVVTSALTFAETGRAIVRARTAGRLTPAQEQSAARALRTFERRCFVLDITRAVLDRARRPLPAEPIRTLHAVHLATAELLGETPALLTIVTRDDCVRRNAEALGYVVD